PTRIQPRKPLNLGKNVFENKTDIMPTISGIIHYSSEVIEVIPTLIIKEPVINQNIEFDGTVIIENMVQNSTIKATHDITIYSTSDTTILEAKGYIYLLTGFFGNSSKATAKKGIFCGYVHNSKLTTIEGDINIGYESLHATLNSGKSIYIEKKAAGGKLTAKENIIMTSSGAERITTKTELTLNYDINKKNKTIAYLIQEMQTTERKYQNATKELSRYEISSEKSKNLLIKDSAFIQLTSIVFELQEQLKEQLNILSKNKTSNEEVPLPQRTGLIVIKDKAWNGTSITINKENFIIDKNANQGSTFHLGNYGIIRERYEQEDII
ncbi:MAG: FapA family protein, partial [Candidatus Riflemargulisbacteria bacterium]